MKRIITFTCIIFVYVTGCRKADNEPTQIDYRIVKRLDYHNLTAQEPYGITEYTYDTNGSDMPPTLPQSANITDYRYFKYKDNRPHSVYTYSNQGGGLALWHYTHYFYSQEKTSRTESYQADGTLTSTTDYEYEGGNLVGIISTDRLSAIVHHNRFTYDTENRITLQERYYQGQSLMEYNIYRYDSRGRLTEKATYDANDQLIDRVEYKYLAQQAAPIEEITYWQGRVTHIKWAYDALGNQVSGIQSAQSGGSECQILQRKYDGYRILEETQAAPNLDCAVFNFTRYEYEKL